MNKYIFLFLFISIEIMCQSNFNITGKWQCCDSLVSAGYLSVFEFTSDSTFKYLISEYAQDNPIESISGRYNLISDTLFFHVKYFDYKDGSLRLGEIENEDSDIFVFDYEKTKLIECKNNCEFNALIKRVDTTLNDNIILINGFDFYKIE